MTGHLMSTQKADRFHLGRINDARGGNHFQMQLQMELQMELQKELQMQSGAYGRGYQRG
jgi:hypothetical protein